MYTTKNNGVSKDIPRTLKKNIDCTCLMSRKIFFLFGGGFVISNFENFIFLVTNEFRPDFNRE